jgi:hypothetical protein
MFNKTILSLLLLIFFSLSTLLYSQPGDDKVVTDVTYKFTLKLPNGWEMKDMKETKDKDGISYTFESKDKKTAIMLLAFKLNSVKNIEDFIYNLEKDISLNIPQRSGEYSDQDFGKYDMKTALYKDNKFNENIYYFRTKLPDAPNNYVYMVRFITEAKDYNTDTETMIKNISATFVPTTE